MMTRNELIKELEKRAKSYWDYYDDCGDIQGQGIAQGLEEAIQTIKNNS